MSIRAPVQFSGEIGALDKQAKVDNRGIIRWVTQIINSRNAVAPLKLFRTVDGTL